MNASRRALLAGAGLLAMPGLTWAQAWPERPVRLIVPFAPGGPTDILARALAERLFDAWHQPVVVENRPGAGSSIGTEYVARQPPDGYTLLFGATAHVMNPPLLPRLPYDPVRDFTAIINAAFHPMVLVVHPSVPVRTVPEFLALAKSRPGGVTMGSAGIGNASHLATALFSQVAGVELTHVPFNGAAPAQTAILSGQVQAGFLNSTVAVQQIRAGTLRGLAVADARRWRELPDLPTLPELGFTGVEAVSWYGILAPAGLPAPLTERLYRDILAVLHQPAMRERIIRAGLDPIEVGPAEFQAQLGTELAKWTRVIREAGIKPD
ncbi:tripartite tricarboxylate transporter substrate binding protein [Siccirubricoccus sp. G192]|uniref:Bug family tripartite tricarboxylate transporter substrate binding protein n=1 Tax=Siccirubricoccus sp. G192 TaxID=2849651 RepID=UPI001C2C1FC7|nr:tripartite tricarboxylate transporter substrate binding protein [Siccirubricoccus sp. G192]MBV1796127.1 tripartite tricarboxylate transporter substrate binding protein [Siccirubricoccus sp. G192]